LGYSVPGGYKYGDLTLQVWGVSETKTAKYGHQPPGFGPRMIATAQGKLIIHIAIISTQVQFINTREGVIIIVIWIMNVEVF
jgi:hypothetical protein